MPDQQRPKIKNFTKGVLTFPMYKPVFHNGTKRKKVVIDYEGSKRLVHIYVVGEMKIWSNKIYSMEWSIRAIVWLLYISTLYKGR